MAGGDDVDIPVKKRRRVELVLDLPTRRDDPQSRTSSEANQTLLVDTATRSQLEWYAQHVDKHILSSHRHVLGDLPTPLLLGPTRLSGNLPTRVPPSNDFWTWSEKCVLFASLARHSRLRPDLIALDIGTKTEAQVIWYLNLLQRCSQVVRYGKDVEGDEFGDEGVADFRPGKKGQRGIQIEAKWGGSHVWREGFAPSAREVSDQWVEKEESLSASVEDYIRTEFPGNLDQAVKSRKRRREIWELKELCRDLSETDVHAVPKAKRRTRKLAFQAGMEALQGKWALQDWGEELGVEKLGRLDRLMLPTHTEWYAKRLVKDDDALLDPASPSGQPLLTPVLNTEEKRGTTVQAENEELDSLLAIPKKQRSRLQGDRIQTLRNKKRNREKYRTKRLLEQGMGMQEIIAAGGADVVIETRKSQKAVKSSQSIQAKSTRIRPGYKWKNRKQDIKDESGRLETWSVSGSSESDREAEGTSAQGESDDESMGGDEDGDGDVDLNADVDLTELKRIGIDRFIKDHGLELFNYDTIAKYQLRSIHTDSEDAETLPVEAGPKISFDILQILRGRLLAFLTPLIHQSILLGEQSARQMRDLSVADDDMEESEKENGDDPDPHRKTIAIDHVRLALDVFGIEPLNTGSRRRSLKSFSTQSSQEGRASTEDDDPSGRPKSRLKKLNSTYPSSRESWSCLPSLNPLLPLISTDPETIIQTRRHLDLTERLPLNNPMRGMLLRRLAPRKYLNPGGEWGFGYDDSLAIIDSTDTDRSYSYANPDQDDASGTMFVKIEAQEKDLDRALDKLDSLVDDMVEKGLWDSINPSKRFKPDMEDFEAKWSFRSFRVARFAPGVSSDAGGGQDPDVEVGVDGEDEAENLSWGLEKTDELDGSLGGVYEEDASLVKRITRATEAYTHLLNRINRLRRRRYLPRNPATRRAARVKAELGSVVDSESEVEIRSEDSVEEGSEEEGEWSVRDTTESEEDEIDTQDEGLNDRDDIEDEEGMEKDDHHSMQDEKDGGPAEDENEDEEEDEGFSDDKGEED